ncbi:MAG: hypothetical protein FIA99_10410 [Ruminiclostridium sp.]|nr:hypothetical protein [Ruminiclostridium sp.]
MPSRVIVTGIILIIIVAMLVFSVEFFLPISIKGDMNILCRKTLLGMETAGGLKEDDRQELVTELQNIGFTNISVSGTQSAKQGEILNLRVEAEYGYSRLTMLFLREVHSLLMVYDKSSLSRKVVN